MRSALWGFLGAVLGALAVWVSLGTGLLPGREAPSPLRPSLPPVSSPRPEAPAVEVAERVGPAVVGVINEEVFQDWWTGEEAVQRSSGSGVVFDPRGYIVTNYHVVEGADRVMVALADGKTLRGKVVGTDPPTDLAVLKVEASSPLPAVSFADTSRLRVGEVAIAIGHPLGMQFERTVTVGVVSGIRYFTYGQDPRLSRVFKLIQTDAAINPGNSGGALLNARGELIGINTFKFQERENIEGMGFAIPAETVKRVAEELVRWGRVRRAWLGAQFIPAEWGERLFGTPAEKGVFLGRLVPGGPAVRAGLRTGDLILGFDDREIRKAVDAISVLELKKPGQSLRVRFRRNGQERVVTVTLGEMP